LLQPSDQRIGAPAIDVQTGEILDAVRVERLAGETFLVRLNNVDDGIEGKQVDHE
jgi:hypothetical protein